jgi:hypothetical protein
MMVELNGNTHSLASSKGKLSAKLTGVFAVMGAEKWTYGDHFINVALNAVFANDIEAKNADEAKIKSLKGAFLAYAEALDLKTSYLAGSQGKAVRGQDFVSSANFGYDQTVQIFADSKAVFFKQGNWAFGNIEGVNKAQAERLEFVPVKMPFKSQDVKRTDGTTVAHLNSSIPVFVPNYYAVNARVPKDEQQKAFDDLKNEPITLFNKGFYIHKVVMEEFKNIGVDTPNIILKTSQVETVKKFILTGISGGFLTKDCVQESDDLVEVPFKNPRLITIGLEWKNGKYLCSDVANFIKYINETSKIKK